MYYIPREVAPPPKKKLSRITVLRRQGGSDARRGVSGGETTSGSRANLRCQNAGATRRFHSAIRWFRSAARTMHGTRLVLCLAVILSLGECFLAPGLSVPNSRRGGNSVRMIAEPLATSSEAALLIENEELRQKVLMLEDTIERTEGLCEPLMGGSWAESLQTRATWLIGLLIAQSCSSFILADNEDLLATHPTVIFFLTMLVGAGGNAGNQASVRLIRGLATGEVNMSREQTMEILANEARIALALGTIRECTPCACTLRSFDRGLAPGP